MSGSRRPELQNVSQLPGPSSANGETLAPLPMRISLQGLITQVAGYGVGAVVNRIIGIVVACIYPMLLSKDEYGRLDVVFSVTALLTVLFYVGLDTALQRFYYEFTDKEKRRRLVSTVFYVIMGLTLVSIGLMLFFSKPLALWLYEDPRYIFYFRLALCAMPFLMAGSFQLVILRLESRIRLYNIIMAANLVIAAICGVGSILSIKIGAAGVLIGYISGNFATCMAGMWINRREITARPLPGQMEKLLNIGMPLVLSGAAMWLIGYVNRPILVHRVSADELGLYAIASGGVGMLGLLMGAFRSAWQPFSFAIMGREGSENIYGHTLTLFTAVGATIAVCATLLAPYGLIVINMYTHKNWSGAAHLIGPLAIGTVLSAMYLIVQTGAYIARRTNVIALTMGIAAVSNILFNFILIPRFGIMGAASATFLGHLTALIALYTVAQRLAPIPYQPGKLAITLTAAIAVICVSSQIHVESVIRDLSLKAVVLFLYCGTLFATRTITRADLSLFSNLDWRRHKAGSLSDFVESGTIQ